MLTATATGAMVTAATTARAASFGNPDEPPQGAIIDPHIDLKKQMCDALPGASKTEIGKVVVRARRIGSDLPAQQKS
jgi:hypothetical protein